MIYLGLDEDKVVKTQEAEVGCLLASIQGVLRDINESPALGTEPGYLSSIIQVTAHFSDETVNTSFQPRVEQ